MTLAATPAALSPSCSAPWTHRSKTGPAFTRQAVEFHLKNARAWANAATGQDLATQVDPEFVMGPLPIDVTASG